MSFKKPFLIDATMRGKKEPLKKSSKTRRIRHLSDIIKTNETFDHQNTIIIISLSLIIVY
jgi:hypothetical protein